MDIKLDNKILNDPVAKEPELRWLFIDLLLLMDEDHVIEMTIPAIARKIGESEEWVSRGLSRLSKSSGIREQMIEPVHGRGWRVINHRYYKPLGRG